MHLIKVKVKVDSKKDAVVLKAKDSFEVSVRASAERGEANDAVLSVLGKEIGVPASKMRIVKGHRTRSKIIEIWE